MLKVTQFSRKDKLNLLKKLVKWSEQYDYASILNSNQYEDKYGSFELLAAFGGFRVLQNGTVEELKAFYEEKPTWLFGHLGYDLKNQLEKLKSRHSAKFDFGDLTFFEPRYLFIQKRNSNWVEVYVQEGEPEEKIIAFLDSEEEGKLKQEPVAFQLRPRQTKEEYLTSIQKLKAEIQYGNIYEINYCQEFFAEQAELKPGETFLQLNEKSPMPFSAFYKNKTDYLLCASPERYLTKKGDDIFSQPIKGTAKRGKTKEEDKLIIENLRHDLKEQTENVMIVDLVRNDLSRTAAKGSVKVEELFGVYSFPQVHQLISTITSKLSSNHHFTDVIRYSFPMGSMTGAPKISAMKLADAHEQSRRELYSGSVGYIQPNGDFDFNVVIRSLLYSEKTKFLSLTVGGAITNMSVAENEYEECLLKAKAIFELHKP